jgi:hypothetical protein
VKALSSLQYWKKKVRHHRQWIHTHLVLQLPSLLNDQRETNFFCIHKLPRS